jgi:predicted DNA-binding transcriptional regulator YafY
MIEQADGSLTVRVHAGGMREMALHLFTWGDAVEVIQPKWLKSFLHQ